MNSEIAERRADELFNSGWNCAESVFVALHEQTSKGEAPVQLLTPLGGGMGCKRTCGALTGAVVALGITHGRTTTDAEAKKVCSAKAHDLCKSFLAKFHSMDCWELTCDYDNEPDRKRGCTVLVRTAVELASRLIEK
jgi:C_GCAxxG_C_C family probable redox protein